MFALWDLKQDVRSDRRSRRNHRPRSILIETSEKKIMPFPYGRRNFQDEATPAFRHTGLIGMGDDARIE